MSNLSRITFIDERIRTRGFVTRQEVADTFEVHLDTIKRDIEYMKLFLKAPIEYSAKRRGYHYAGPFETVFSAAEDAALYYLFVLRLTESFRKEGLPYIPVISKDILAKVKEYVPPEYDRLLDRVSYESSDLDTMEVDTFRTVLRAIQREEILSLHYADAQGEETERRVEPMRLMNYLGKWYLAGYCHTRKALRTFLVSRIEKASLSGEPFEKRFSEKEAEDFLSGSFGMYKSDNPQTAVVRFYEPAMHRLKDQKWHRKQTTTFGENAHGKYVEFSLPVGWGYDELMARVMAYAPHGEVVGPEEFRKHWEKTTDILYQLTKKEAGHVFK